MGLAGWLWPADLLDCDVPATPCQQRLVSNALSATPCQQRPAGMHRLRLIRRGPYDISVGYTPVEYTPWSFNLIVLGPEQLKVRGSGGEAVGPGGE